MLVLILLWFSANAYLSMLLTFDLCDGMSFYEVLNLGLRRKQIRSRVERSSFPLCSEDEYFDAYVESCSRCSDICRPNIPDVTICVSKCRDYFLRQFNSSSHPGLKPSLSVTPSSTVVYSPGGDRETEEESLVNKPLFWTSIVSMTIATLATVAIIVLCVKRRKLLRSAVVSRSWTVSGRTENSKGHKSFDRTDGKPDESSGKSRQEERGKRRRDDWSLNESTPTTNVGHVDENYNTGADHCRPKRTDHPTPSQDNGQNNGPVLTTIVSASESQLSRKKAQTVDSKFTDFQMPKAYSSSVTSVAKPRDSCSRDAAESEIKRVKYDDRDETNLKRCTADKPDAREYNCGPIRLPEDIGIKTVKNNSIAFPGEILRMKINIRDIREEENEAEPNSNYGIFSLTEDELQSASLIC